MLATLLLTAQATIALGDLRRPVPFGPGFDIVLVDLNGDEVLDIVEAYVPPTFVFGVSAGGAAATTVAAPLLLINDRNGNFEPLEDPRAAFEGPFPEGRSVAAGDLNGDGLVDLVIDDRVHFMRPEGGFRRGPLLNSAAEILRSVVVDVDGDGAPDVVSARYNRVTVWRNRGDETFVRLQNIPGGGSLLAAGDLDGDGDVDLVGGATSSFFTLDLEVYWNDGGGMFQTALLLTTSATGMEVADLDGDGRCDVVVATQEEILLLTMAAAGSFEVDVISSSGARGGLALADLDQDGDVDVLALNPSLLLVNQGGGRFLDGSANLPGAGLPAAYRVAVGDLDRDGDPDLAAAADAYPRLLLGDGDGRFTEAQRNYPLQDGHPEVLADLDGDGDLDLLVDARGRVDGVSLWINDGSGAFHPDTELLPFPLSFGPAAVGDVDGDGDTDILWLGAPGHLLLATSGGFVEAVGALPPRGILTKAVELMDLDADGDLDAFLAQGTYGAPAPARVWRNDGSGRFVDAGPLPAAGTPVSLALGDLNGDGAPDAFVANEGPSNLFLGDGWGGFVDATASLPPEAPRQRTDDVALVDLDGDGDLDVYVIRSEAFLVGGGSFGPMPDQILWNDGSGALTASPAPNSSSHSRSLAAADLDGDGDVDVAVGRGTKFLGELMDDETQVYSNDGQGQLTLAIETRRAFEQHLLAGDVDGDGDVDLVSEERVLTNLHTALAWRLLPRAGRPLELELFGPREGSYRLLLSPATASLLTDAGLLRLDPSQLTFVRHGRLDADGRSVERFAVPDRLVGHDLYWQAWIGPQGTLTNLERTRFLPF